MTLLCRIFGHKWVHMRQHIPRELLKVCDRCGMIEDNREDFEKFCKKELGED